MRCRRGSEPAFLGCRDAPATPLIAALLVASGGDKSFSATRPGAPVSHSVRVAAARAWTDSHRPIARTVMYCESAGAPHPSVRDNWTSTPGTHVSAFANSRLANAVETAYR
jgi:hypothetical protein